MLKSQPITRLIRIQGIRPVQANFHLLVPTSPDDPSSGTNRAAWDVLRALPLPVLTTFGADDKITAGVERVFQAQMPGAKDQAHVMLPYAGHLLQEDVGPELARRIDAFVKATEEGARRFVKSSCG